MTAAPALGRGREREPALSETARLIERLEEGAAVCDDHGRIVTANAAWRKAVGAAPRELRLAAGLFAPLLKARREGFSDGLLPHPDGDLPVRIATLDETRFLLRLSQAVRTVSAEPAESAPRASPIGALIGPSPFGAAVLAPGDPFTAAILESNQRLAQIVGASPESWSTLSSLLTAPSAAEAARRHAAGRSGPFEVCPAGAPERTAQLYLSLGEAGSTAWLIDVTDQKAMERQLAQRNKMEAIGQLAGGVAHDFNNLLTAIRLRADELLLRHPLGDPAYDSLGEIRDTVLRAADLVRQLLTFSRKATTRREIFDIGETLMGFEVLLRRLLREDVRLVTDYSGSTPPVRADKAQLENAVMNLVVNARDAVRGVGGGRITLRCAGLTGAEAKALGYPGPPAPKVALIEVADDGPGIPAGVAAHIFEPFYTTKAVGEGTGLGLSTVYGIVQQAEGWISLDTQPGEGSRFRIFLPAAEPALVLETPEPVKAPPRDLSGAGRILFVEDEPLVRGIAARLLRTRGYEVIEAVDGEEALDLAREHAGKIDLIISDVIMPGMDGPALLKAARPHLGEAPVIFISGYAEAEFSEVLEGERGVSFLAKPLDIMSLAEQVKQRLHGG